jgi:hypothetical protein
LAVAIWRILTAMGPVGDEHADLLAELLSASEEAASASEEAVANPSAPPIPTYNSVVLGRPAYCRARFLCVDLSNEVGLFFYDPTGSLSPMSNSSRCDVCL